MLDADWNGFERRRSPRPERPVADITKPYAPPATVTEIVRWSGLSRNKVLADIEGGSLTPCERPRVAGSKLLFPAAETVRYLRSLGVLNGSS